jgi:hypothetical protein
MNKKSSAPKEESIVGLNQLQLKPAEEPAVVPEPAPEPPKTRNIITELTVVNNNFLHHHQTPLIYRNAEGNEFGLTWYSGKGNEKLLIIQQLLSKDKETWNAMCRLLDHSVISIKRETITIAQ